MRPRDLNRIVSLEPSVTATLFALGQQARLVAVSEWCQRLVDVGDLPRLPATRSAQPEDITGLEPDLVMASVPYRAETIAELLRAGLNVPCLSPQRLEDACAHILWLGRAADQNLQSFAADGVHRSAPLSIGAGCRDTSLRD